MTHKEKAIWLVKCDKQLAKEGYVDPSEIPSVDDYMSLDACTINQIMSSCRMLWNSREIERIQNS